MHSSKISLLNNLGAHKKQVSFNLSNKSDISISYILKLMNA